MTIYHLLHSPWWLPFVGICALTTVCALLRNINAMDADVLPEPDRSSTRGDQSDNLWISSGGRS